MRRRMLLWVLVGVVLGWIVAPALPSAAPLLQNVILFTQSGTTRTALTMTGTNLNVTCQ